METMYYIIVNGQQVGPISRHSLLGSGLKPDSYIWREGLEEWVIASTLPEIAELFAPPHPVVPPQPVVEPEPVQPAEPVQPQYGEPVQPQPYQEPVQPQPYQPQPYQEPVQPQPIQQPYQYEAPHEYDNTGAPIAHTNYMVGSIIAMVVGFFTLCGCVGLVGLIFGIIACVKSSNANKYYANGDRMNGDAANSSAKTMLIIAFIFDGLGVIGFILNFIVGFMQGFMEGLAGY